MIFTFFLWVPVTLVYILTEIFPQVTSLPVAVQGAFVFFGPLLAPFTYWFPLITLFEVLALVVSIEILFLGWRIFWWIWAKIPVIGH